eukprot:scaffold119056_cov15-Tisochrysis_lutea.AAC.1
MQKQHAKPNMAKPDTCFAHTQGIFKSAIKFFSLFAHHASYAMLARQRQVRLLSSTHANSTGENLKK